MSEKPNLPLNLYQVLEEEYESLHGPLPPETTAYMPQPDGAAGWSAALTAAGWSAAVTSKRDWDFHAKHLKSPAAFARILLGGEPERRAGVRAPAPRMAGQEGVATLAECLRGHLRRSLALVKEIGRKQKSGAGEVFVGGNEVVPDDKQLAAVLRAVGDSEAGEKILRGALNAALGDRQLYGEEDGGGRLVAGRERFTYEWLSDATRGLLSLRESGVSFGPEEVRQFNRHLLEDAFPDAFWKVADVRLSAVYSLLHKLEQAALSLSGGGIRSGTFALGVMQGLARHRLLEKFDYLSTVSGGGYTGAWLTAWIHRHPEGLAGVSRDLADGSGDKIDPDAAPLRYLRRYSNFITPKVGLLTADTWTFIGIYLRNTFLNWLVFVPLILSALMIPRLLLALTLMQPEAKTPGGEPEPLDFLGLGLLHVPHRHIFLGLGVLLGGWALAYVIVNKPNLRVVLEQHHPRFRGKTGQGGFLLLCLLPLLVSAFCLTTYYAWSREVDEGLRASVLWFLGFGVVFIVVAVLFASLVLRQVPLGHLIPAAEVLGLIAVGLLGGLLFWALAQIKHSPVVSYGGNSPFNWNNVDWLAWHTEVYVCLAVPLFLLVFLFAAVIFIGLTSTRRFANLSWFKLDIEDEDREWWARFGAWLLITIIVWVAGTGIAIFGPLGLLALPRLLALVGGASGLLTLLAGRSSKTPASEGGQAQQGWLDRLTGSLLPVLALVFVVILVAAFSLATSGLIQAVGYGAGELPCAPPSTNAPPCPIRAFGLDVERLTNARNYEDYRRYIYGDIRADSVEAGSQLVHMNVLHHTSLWLLLNLAAWLFGVGMLLARVINLNIFSLNGGYRNRLIRAFLGASRLEQERRPNPFTGFDPSDNLHMHELRHALLAENDLDEDRLHVLLEPLSRAKAEDAGLLERKEAAPPPDGGGREEEEEEHERQTRERDEAVRLLTARLAARKGFKTLQAKLKGYDKNSPAPRQLIAELRVFLNGVIEGESLYEQPFGALLLGTGRAAAVGEKIRAELRRGLPADAPAEAEKLSRASLRSDYHLLLNRLVLEEAYRGALRPCVAPPYKLMHVVNTTLNLVGGDNLAWQQRKAEPFSVSPLHAGCFRVGYRNSRDYGGRSSNGISLGTAATASGAAASSNMGYYTTSPLISLLLTFFNVRLGLWLGNPGAHGQETYYLGAPTLSFKPVLSEAFGLTDDTNPYVYLTDGGHFENLAFYEMVLRRCRFIVVSDAAADAEFRFGDLGNAVRKIRIDLGVPIDFWDVNIHRKAPPAAEGRGVYWALARIRYTWVDKDPEARDGVLLYVKPTVYGDEPRDVLEYKESFPDFPHQSTADQFFDEPQFESYRVLGSHVMDRICGDKPADLEMSDLVCKALEELKSAKPASLDNAFKLDPKFLEWIEAWCKTAGAGARPAGGAAAGGLGPGATAPPPRA
jgi:hypothetical protein